MTKSRLVTGASQGIGQAIAIVREIQALHRRAMAVPLNVTDKTSIGDAVERALIEMKRIDMLVNNAGAMQESSGLDTSETDFDRCYEVNVKGTWLVTQAVLPFFKAQREGRIINIASGAGRRGQPEFPAYCASKAAQISLTQSLAVALGPDNITVNVVCPGLIRTAMSQHLAHLYSRQVLGRECSLDELLKRFEETIPLRRPQTVQDIGDTVVFLASAAAKNITGQALNVDGGILMN